MQIQELRAIVAEKENAMGALKRENDKEKKEIISYWKEKVKAKE